MPVSRNRLPTLKRGDIVEIEFLDHVCITGGMAEPIRCRCIGELLNEDKKAFYIASWLTEENETHNMDSHTILKSTVDVIRVIRRKKRLPGHKKASK